MEPVCRHRSPSAFGRQRSYGILRISHPIADIIITQMYCVNKCPHPALSSSGWTVVNWFGWCNPRLNCSGKGNKQTPSEPGTERDFQDMSIVRTFAFASSEIRKTLRFCPQPVPQVEILESSSSSTSSCTTIELRSIIIIMPCAFLPLLCFRGPRLRLRWPDYD